MSRVNSFKEPKKEKDQFNNIKTLLKDKNLNPNKIEDLKYLLSLTIDPVIKEIKLEYLVIFLLKYLNAENESIFYKYFFQYCELGKIQYVKILLEDDIDVNCQNELGETPLHIAIGKKDVELIKLLIKYEPDTSLLTYKDKFTVMNYAEIYGNKIIINMIKDLNENNKKKLIKNEIFDYINKGINNINNNISIKDTSSYISGNMTNIDQIQNYNGEKMSSFANDEEMSSSILTNHLSKNIPNSKLVNHSDSKYINTQTIINESDYCEDYSPKNRNIVNNNNKNSNNEKNLKLLHEDSSNSNKINLKQMPSETKLFSSSLKRKEESLNHYNNYSVNPSYIQSLTTCHTLNKDHIESTSPIVHHMSLRPIKPPNKKEKLFKFIQEINLPKEYANNLLDNGFDVLDVLISQSKKGTALTYQNLKDVGVKLPGERAKILVHLEEISGNFDFYLDKEIIYANKHIDDINNSLYKFLSSINCEKYINNFIDNGYYNAELLFIQMASKQPLNEDILIKDLGLNKMVAKKILCNLIESSNIYINRIKNSDKGDGKKKTIIFEENNNNMKSCDMCFVF